MDAKDGKTELGRWKGKEDKKDGIGVGRGKDNRYKENR